MSALLTLIVVMSMLCVVTLMNLTIAHVRLKMMEMANRSVQNADCRLQTGYKMQTRYQMQTEDCRPYTKCRLSSKCRPARKTAFFRQKRGNIRFYKLPIDS